MQSQVFLRFPAEYPNMYVRQLGEWWSEQDYASVMTQRHTEFLIRNGDEEGLFIFASHKLGKGKGFALMGVGVSIIGDDAYIKGIQYKGTFIEPLRSNSKNKAYLKIMMDENNNDYDQIFYLGIGDSMKQVKEIIEAWIMGEINDSGSIPEYDFVEILEE